MEKMLSSISQLTPQQKELLEELLKQDNIDIFTDIEKGVQDIEINPVSKQKNYVMSSAQKRLFVLEQIEGANVSYNMPNYLELSGELDMKKIEDIFSKLILRHESLRTSFKIENSMFVQEIQEEANFYVEFKTVEELYLEEELDNFVKPFHLTIPPLIRVMVIQCRNKNILAFDMHHIISDGISMGIIADEISRLYNGEILLPLPIQYKDFSEWQQKQFQSKKIMELEKFWLNVYKETPPLLNLMTDYQRPVIQSHEGTTLKFIISNEKTDRIKNFALKTETTNYIILFAAYNIFLSKYTGQEDIIVGCPVAGRPHPNLENIVGMFVNTLAIRNYPIWDKLIIDFIKEVKEICLKSFDNQEYPFERLIDNLGCQREISRNPLFDTVFVMQVTGNKSVKIDNGLFVPYNVKNKISKFDITFNIREEFGSFVLDIEYCTKLFKESSIIRLANAYFKVIDDIIQNPKQLIGDIEIISEEEKQKICSVFHNNQVKYSQNETVCDIFERIAKKYSSKVAVVYGENCLTYDQLNKHVNRLARILRKHGAAPGKIISLVAERSLEMIIGMLAVLKAGGAYLPIDSQYPKERIQYMIEDSKSEIIVTNVLGLEEMLASSVNVIQICGRYEGQEEDTDLEHVNVPNDLAYIIYTSGTTGKPKGAMVQHCNLVSLLFHDNTKFDFTEKDIWTMFHSISFDFSVWEVYGALLYGGKLIVVPKAIAQEPADFSDLLQEQQVTVLNQTPTAFMSLSSEILKKDDIELSVRTIIFGGEALNPKILQGWHQKYRNTKLINMYGITETTIHVTYKEITDKEIDTNVSNIGVPIPTLTVYIMDKNLKLLPIGVPGEICVGGEGVCKGYLFREELTKEKFIDNPYNSSERLYRSGDMAKLLSNGELQYLGRIDQQVKIRGHRIELEEVNIQLLNIKQVEKAVTIAKKDSEGNQYLCSYIVVNKIVSTDLIRKKLSDILPVYMVPSYIIALEQFPMTANGKIDIKLLPELSSIAQDSLSYISPQNQRENSIKKIWEEILLVPKIGMKDNFFSIGGDSIKAIQIINNINELFSSRLKIKDIYKNQTIRELASIVYASSDKSDKEQVAEGLLIINEFKHNVLNKMEFHDLLPEDWEDFYPLSQIQKGMVFYSELRPDEPIYHDQFVYPVIFEKFHVDYFTETLQILIKRHPILRTKFISKEVDEPIQVVYENVVPCVVFEDISGLSNKSKKEKMEVYIKADLKKSFTFERELLWRMGIFRINASEFYIILSFQHAILDGWSVSTLNRDFTNIYSGIIEGKEVTLPRLRSSYKDYVAYCLSKNMNDHIRLFWQETLKDYIPNKLPFNYTGAIVSGEKGSKIVRRNLEPNLLKKLKIYGKNKGCSVKEICLSSYIFLMKILCNENDIVTGLVTHDRPIIDDSEKILGCFLNTIPIRMKLENKVNKTSLLKNVKEYLKKLKENEIFLAELANIVNSKGKNGNPIFDTLFNFTDFHVLNGAITQSFYKKREDDIEIESNEMTNTLFDLEVSMTNSTFSMQVKYAPAYFYEKDIDTAIGLYSRILEEFMLAEKEFFCIEELLTEKERKEIQYGFNNTNKKYDKDILLHQLFEKQVLCNPNQTALSCMDKEISYKQLNIYGNQLGRILIEKGIKNGDNVALITDRGFEMIIGMLAILKAGAVYIPIDSEYPLERQKYIIKNAQVAAVLTSKESVSDVFLEHMVILIDYSLMSNYVTDNLESSSSSRDIAYVIYTSGSTGNPKGVMIEHTSAVNLIQWVNKQYNVNHEDSLLFITSMCFDLSVYDIFGILASGGKIVIAQKMQIQDPMQLKKLLVEKQITFWNSVPSTMNYLIGALESDDQNYVQKSLKLVFMSGDWIPVHLPEKIKKFFPSSKVISLGGATEAAIWSIFYPIENVNKYQTSIPYGKPIDNNYFYILNEEKQMVPYGVAGELYIGGIGVARGYINDSERTNAAFSMNHFLSGEEERLYKTGDMGRMLPDGNIEFLGRKDSQVKIRGYRIELGEIENQLQSNHKIRDAVVLGKTDQDKNQYLCAYIVIKDEISVQKIKEFMITKLPEYMIPIRFVYLDSLPLTENGKIDRKSLPEPSENIIPLSDFEFPSGEMEIKISKIWEEVLEIHNIGINDNFFDIGGHSLKATILASRIHKVLNVKIPLKDIFSTPTIKGMAEYAEHNRSRDFNHIRKAQKKTYYPLSSAQKRLFILDSREEMGVGYNMADAMYLYGTVDLTKMEQIFKKLILRHESLRTSFKLVNGEPVQEIYDEIEFKIDCFEAREEGALDLIRNFIMPFHLEKGPLIKVMLISLESEKHILAYDMHHIISDGFSMQILVREFMLLYNGQELLNQPIQYKDFAVWQQEELEKGKLLLQKDYWLNKFSGSLPVITLPTDYDSTQFHGSSIKLTLDSKVRDGLSKLASSTETTLYMVLLAVYNVLVAKYSGGEDIIIGTPVSGRNHDDLQNVIGMFVNTLPMRNYPTTDKTFSNFLKEVKETAIEAFENQDYPLEDLVNNLKILHTTNQNPLFNIMFVMQNISTEEIRTKDLIARPYELDIPISKFDLTLEVRELRDSLIIRFEYRTELFKTETIEKLLNDYINILERVLEKPNVILGQIDIRNRYKAQESVISNEISFRF